jgi:lipopolysaccharide/colanic/teichoic acid biosynthesis glycosyltransferase
MRRTKRFFDLFCAVLGLLVLWPLFLLIALFIKLDDGGAVFYCQKRIGHKGRPFCLYKFRTMTDVEGDGALVTIGQDKRITRVGRQLRKFKFDELPQLFNIVKGEMSLVGPRPEVPEYVALYTSAHRRVLDLIPGITDPASVEYHNESDLLGLSSDPETVYLEEIMPAKLKLSLDYAERATALSDTLVILQTLSQILR